MDQAQINALSFLCDSALKLNGASALQAVDIARAMIASQSKEQTQEKPALES